jgi:hypothetical protein
MRLNTAGELPKAPKPIHLRPQEEQQERDSNGEPQEAKCVQMGYLELSFYHLADPKPGLKDDYVSAISLGTNQCSHATQLPFLAGTVLSMMQVPIWDVSGQANKSRYSRTRRRMDAGLRPVGQPQASRRYKTTKAGPSRCGARDDTFFYSRSSKRRRRRY